MLWYLLKAPRQDTSNEYPQHMFSLRNKKIIHLIPSPLQPLLSRDIVRVLVFFNDKTYFVGFRWNGLIDAILMSTHMFCNKNDEKYY